MKRTLLLSASAVLCLLLPAVSFAEPQRGGEAGGGHTQGGGHAQMSRPTGGSARTASRATTSRSYTTHATTSRPYATHASTARQTYRRSAQGQTRVASAASHPQATAATTRSRDADAVQGGARHAELNRNVQAPHGFQAGAYRQPQGYQQRHWGFGEQLPGAYFARNYWLTDFALYGLFGPPEGLVWVRVGPDALLIDQYNGEIVQADYGVFI